MSVQLEKDALVIRIEAKDPQEELFNMQSNIIRLLQCREPGNQSDQMDLWYGLELLHELLPNPDDRVL
jgi:hypothetical protein